MTWLARWRARRRQHNAALDGDTNAFLNEALPVSLLSELPQAHRELIAAKMRAAALAEPLDVAGRPDHDNGDLADPSTTPKHRKAKP